MNKTNIEWTNGGYTWNPVTGCLHSCPYCYARRIARRFSAHNISMGTVHIHDAPFVYDKYEGYGEYVPTEFRVDNYPFVFDPTFHRYRFKDPQTVKRPSNVFVCSMADLFGEWVPDEWIEAVFDVCRKARQHNYLFLTKNPKRYVELNEVSDLFMGDNAWFGTSYTNTADDLLTIEGFNTFVSIEPILEPLPSSALEDLGAYQWVIVGASQGHYKGYTQDDFVALLDVLKNIKGKFLLSSYEFDKSLLCDTWYQQRHVMVIAANNTNKGTQHKTEVLTYNYRYIGEQLNFFEEAV